jgi:hypothetical protein
MRGQSNFVLLALLCASAAATVRGQRFRSGFWLAGTICLKLYPAFLVLFPLWRRDGRALAGCAVGLFVGLAVLPAAAFGVPRALAYYEEYGRVFVLPALGLGEDRSRATEITESTANDSQSLVAALHNGLHLDRNTRPPHADQAVEMAAHGICALLTLLTFAAAGLRRAGPAAAVLLFGSLIIVMLLAAPVCHMHYFTFLVPLLMGVLTARWRRRNDARVGPAWAAVLWLGGAAYVLASLPGMETLRDVGLSMYPVLLIWVLAVAEIWKQRGQTRAEIPLPHASGLAA